MNKYFIKIDYFDNRLFTNYVGYISNVKKYRNLETTLVEFDYVIDGAQEKAHIFSDSVEATNVKDFINKNKIFNNLRINNISILEII